MRSTRNTLLLAALAALAACTDNPSQPLALPEGQAPLANVRAGRVSVTAYGHLSSGGTNWAPAIDAAQQAAGTVEFPQGTYPVTSTVSLRSGTRLVGVGAGSVISYSGPRYALLAQGTPWAFVTGITVDSLAFQGTGSEQQTALRVVNGGDVTVRWNNVRRIGLVESDIEGVSSPTRANLNYNFTVTGNWGDGERPQFTGAPNLWGVYLAKIHTVTVSHNQFYNYRVGIQWWGNDAGVERNGQYHTLPRLAQDWTVEYNTVVTNQEGIWGSMGQNIMVRGNYVENCVDVCLDDEGGINVKFHNNEARYAGQYVLAVFDFAQGAEFVGNHVYQDGRTWPPFADQGYHPGVRLFGNVNPNQAPADISITVRDNHFYYTGGGVGRVVKGAAKRLDFNNNTLSNTVIDMAPNNGGSLQVAYNQLSFSQGTSGEYAILTGGNHGEWGSPAATIDGTHHLVVANNTVTSTELLSGQTAIHATQWSGNPVKSWLHHNTIRNFDAAVSTQGSGGAHVFTVQSNSLYRDNPCGFQRFC